ncbi:hypothetical protein [Xenorhabdus taiwanensis]|uniref:Uncharacterized protein n=1 Tax=Xenorhabdus taiwanensis TaxID=3085177 RepID=A0ABN7C2C1_9GAMM|nr:hypothetical protein TCT1_14130 [Xenorhabdus sp. TCT-1]
MPKHIHADLISEYARLAHITDKPWEYFQVKYEVNNKWEFCISDISFNHSFAYRLKPRIIKIGEYDVPEPVSEPLEKYTRYYVPDIDDWVIQNASLIWTNDDSDMHYLQCGLIHLDRESAELHAKALISLTSK